MSRSRQVLNDGLHDQQPTSIHSGMRSHKWNTTKRQRGHTQCTTTSHSSKTRIHDSTTLTGLQQYSSSQGSVERLHRTLLGKIRTFKAHGITLNVKHTFLPWIIRHAARTINRYEYTPTATPASNDAGGATTKEQS